MKFDLEKAKAKIAEFCDPLPACMVCQNTDWVLMDRVFELAEYHPDGLVGKVAPVIILVCVTCTYTISFSAVGLGIVEQTGKE